MRSKKNYLLLVLLVAVVVMIGLWITKILNGTLPYMDQWTRDPVEGLAVDSQFYTVFRWITELGSSHFVIPLVVIMAVILYWKYRTILPVLVFAGGTWGAHVINVWIKHVVQRERPSILVAANAEGYSFPSGHAMISMVCYGLLAYFIVQLVKKPKAKKLIQGGLAFLILLIGISRYVINVHYLTDVMAGFILGYLWVLVMIFLYEKLRHRRKKIQS
ncbi:phosphatase PAP2 family protein [Oceanobacillus picturae]|jgi:membrane-associated phospholipid phosphatase|uniref:phosphatase PAP2 family protein n=1 Tax=Oceanobacillus picturae TaxID=171693 RepID=UPI000E69C3E4|nr:phosphatase PAP2 family protein [Oceanobacillus picturae]RIU90669.1 PAP2 family protein [Oceanobacillus picturae]